MTAPRRVLAIGHDHVSGLGHVGERLRARDCEVTFVRVVPPGRFDRPNVYFGYPDPADWDVVVTTGAPWPRDRIGAWWPREVAFLRRAHERGRRVLGICFGAQLLAEALGGSVRPLAARRLGWHPVNSHDERVSSGPWFQWHAEQLVPPAEATVLAGSADGCEAFAHGRAIGVQFHPEMSLGLVDRWLTVASLRQAVPSAAALRRETASHDTEDLRRRVARLTDALLDGDP